MVQTAQLVSCLAAAKALDPQGSQTALERAATSVSLPVFLEEIVGPLATCIGEQWIQGGLRVFHEHMVTVQLAAFLTNLRLGCTTPGDGPVLLVATPAGLCWWVAGRQRNIERVWNHWMPSGWSPWLDLAKCLHVCGSECRAIRVDGMQKGAVLRAAGACRV